MDGDTTVGSPNPLLSVRVHGCRNFFENMYSLQRSHSLTLTHSVHTKMIQIINGFYSPEIIFSKMKLGPGRSDTQPRCVPADVLSIDRCSHPFRLIVRRFESATECILCIYVCVRAACNAFSTSNLYFLRSFHSLLPVHGVHGVHPSQSKYFNKPKCQREKPGREIMRTVRSDSKRMASSAPIKCDGGTRNDGL